MSGSPLIIGASTEVLGAITTPEVAEHHLQLESAFIIDGSFVDPV